MRAVDRLPVLYPGIWLKIVEDNMEKNLSQGSGIVSIGHDNHTKIVRKVKNVLPYNVIY